MLFFKPCSLLPTRTSALAMIAGSVECPSGTAKTETVTLLIRFLNSDGNRSLTEYEPKFADEKKTAMNDQIITATEAAIRQVRHVRFFTTERGYAAAFYHFLWNEMLSSGLLRPDGNEIIEMETQKSRIHATWQRPDIIFHTPIEVSHGEVFEHNYAAWAFKCEGSEGGALDDFQKLDVLFETLRYPLGFFINVAGRNDYLEVYPGPFRNRLFGIAVTNTPDGPQFTTRCCRDVLR